MKQKRFPYFSFGRAEDSCAKAVKRRRERTLWHFFLASIVGCCVVVSIASSATADGRRPERWVRLSPATSPPARSYLAMTYDPASGKIVMFGGYDGTGYLNDTWTFDGTTWSQVATPISPPRRAAAQIAYDASTQKVVLFGGYDGTRYLGDTWIWNGKTLRWSRAQPACLADSMDVFTNTRCGNGPVPTGTNCLSSCCRMLARQLRLGCMLSPARWLHLV